MKLLRNISMLLAAIATLATAPSCSDKEDVIDGVPVQDSDVAHLTEAASTYNSLTFS